MRSIDETVFQAAFGLARAIGQPLCVHRLQSINHLHQTFLHVLDLLHPWFFLSAAQREPCLHRRGDGREHFWSHCKCTRNFVAMKNPVRNVPWVTVRVFSFMLSSIMGCKKNVMPMRVDHGRLHTKSLVNKDPSGQNAKQWPMRAFWLCYAFFVFFSVWSGTVLVRSKGSRCNRPFPPVKRRGRPRGQPQLLRFGCYPSGWHDVCTAALPVCCVGERQKTPIEAATTCATASGRRRCQRRPRPS